MVEMMTILPGSTMGERQLRPPVQGFLRECQVLLDGVQKGEQLTSMEVKLLSTYVKQVRTYLMLHAE